MTDVVLGTVTFSDMEVPEELPIGGAHAHKLHKLVGGARVLDAMGRDDEPKSWSGRFLGPDALDRALQLEAMRSAGKPVTLSWSGFSFTVFISAYRANFLQPFNLTYSITVEVISDASQPAGTDDEADVDDQVGGDMTTASALSDEVGDATLSSQTGSLASAMAAVPSFIAATGGQIASVLAPLGQAQSRVGALIGSAETTLSGLSGFAGVVAGAPPSASAANLLTALSSMNWCAQLYSLQSVLGRMAKNLASVQKAGTTIISDGLTDLYAYASRFYGDPSAWSTIARANGLTDPEVAGGVTILIPVTPDDDGGVLAA